MPPFRHRLKKGQKKADRVQLSSNACRKGKGVAIARSHNERAMSRLKAFRWFRLPVAVREDRAVILPHPVLYGESLSWRCVRMAARPSARWPCSTKISSTTSYG